MTGLEIGRINTVLKTNGWKDFLNTVYIYTKLLLDIDVIYAISYMLFAILGATLHNFFFAYHLTIFIINQRVLVNVLKAIYNPGWQLFFIFIFFLILEYFYSLIVYYFFYPQMPDNSCASVFICLATIYNNTFTVI